MKCNRICFARLSHFELKFFVAFLRYLSLPFLALLETETTQEKFQSRFAPSPSVCCARSPRCLRFLLSSYLAKKKNSNPFPFQLRTARMAIGHHPIISLSFHSLCVGSTELSTPADEIGAKLKKTTAEKLWASYRVFCENIFIASISPHLAKTSSAS